MCISFVLFIIFRYAVDLKLLQSLKNETTWAYILLLANKTAGFSLIQLYIQNKMMKNPNFLHVDTFSLKLEVDLKM